VARPARIQWWRFTVVNACSGTAVATSSGQGAAPVVVGWAGAAAPPGLYRLRLEAGTSTWTPQTALSWTVEVFAPGTTVLAGCPAERVAGTDRYATAVAVAREAAPAARTVVLAGGEDRSLIDGLVAGPLAASRDAALLLTARATLSAVTAAEITRRAADTVLVIGSQGAVSDDVVAALRGLGVTQIRRLGGADRYATAALVAAEVGAPDGAAFVASGANLSLVDGLAASGPAVRLDRPILLTALGELPAATSAALRDLGVSRTHVVGGTGAVSDAVLADLPGPTRLGGASRFDTAAAVATAFGAAVGEQDVVLAAGVGPLVDALPAGTLGRLVLLTGSTLPAATSAWLTGSAATRLTAVGGPGATTPAAVEGAVRAIRA
jgi:putative cell wall-binding protein